jgi:hypothetical protein
MANPFQASVAEFTPSTPSQSGNTGSGGNGNGLVKEIQETLLTQLSTWEKNETNIDKIFNFIKDYLSFLESKQVIVIPILSKEYGAGSNSNNIINFIGDLNPSYHGSTLNMLYAIEGLTTNKLDPEEKQLIMLLQLKQDESSQSFLVPITKIIKKLPPAERKQLESKFNQAIQSYHKQQQPQQQNQQSQEQQPDQNVTDEEIEIPFIKKKVPRKPFLMCGGLVLLLLILAIVYFFYSYYKGGKSSSLSEDSGSVLTLGDNDDVSIPSYSKPKS